MSSRCSARLEQVLERLHRLVGQRHHEVRADEDVDLGGVQAADLLVVGREVQDDEQVVLVLVDLRTLVAGEDVLVVQRVKAEVLLEPGAIGLARLDDVDPAQAVVFDDLDVGGLRLRSASDGRTAAAGRPPQAGLGQAGHGTSGLVGHRGHQIGIRPVVDPGAEPLGANNRRTPSSSDDPGVTCVHSAPHSWTHPEGWRDWPDETPATNRRQTTRVSRERERCQFLKDVAGVPRLVAPNLRHAQRRFF